MMTNNTQKCKLQLCAFIIILNLVVSLIVSLKTFTFEYCDYCALESDLYYRPNKNIIFLLIHMYYFILVVKYCK